MTPSTRRWRKDPRIRLAVLMSRVTPNPDSVYRLVQVMERVLARQKSFLATWRQSLHARSRQWFRSECRLRDRLLEQIDDLRAALEAPREVLGEGPPHPIPSARLIYDELGAVAAEFEGFSIEAFFVTVETEPVVLEDIPLGPFRIVLDLAQIYQGNPLNAVQTIAIHPNPAGGEDDVVHPHVRSDTPCLGDATLPVRNALLDGRLLDAFQLIDRVLHTYNDGSAYVSLEDWSGSRCDSCDVQIGEDDTWTCIRCSNQLCEHCSHLCHGCESSFCRHHLSDVEGELYCSDCLPAALDAAKEADDEPESDPTPSVSSLPAEPLTPESSHEVVPSPAQDQAA